MSNNLTHHDVIISLNDLLSQSGAIKPTDFTTAQYVEETGCSQDQAYRRLRALRDMGMVENVDVYDDNMQKIRVWRPTENLNVVKFSESSQKEK